MGDLYIRAMCQNILGGSSSVEEQAIIEGCARRIITSGFRVDSSGNITFDGGVTFNGMLTIGSLTIANALIANGNVTLGDAAGDTITVNGTLAADWTFAQITPASAASRLVGRGAAAGGGDFEEITLGSGLSMSGTTLSSTNALLDGTIHTDTTNSPVTRGDLIIGNSTPAWDDLAISSTSGTFLRSDGTDPGWSTLVLPNAITVNQIVFASATNTYGASTNLAFDGSDLILGSGIRARMSSQNRFRFLNSLVLAASTATTTITDSTWTSLALASETVDTDALHDNSTNNSRLTAAITGKYLVTGVSDFTANATGARLLRVFKNNMTTVASGAPAFGATTAVNVGSQILGIVELAATDFIELQAFQTSGINLTNHNTIATNFGMAYLGE